MSDLRALRTNRVSTLGLIMVPVVTLFLGILIGSLEGGLGVASNYGPIAVYVALATGTWVVVDWLARRHEGDGPARR